MNSKQKPIGRLKQCSIQTIFFLLLTGFVVNPALAMPNIFIVTSNADVIDFNLGDGVCSISPIAKACTLRAAIMESAASGPAVIKLDATTYTLTIPGKAENAGATGDLDITSDLTIIGKGINQTSVDAKSIDRVFHIFSNSPRRNFKVTLSNMTISGGDPLADQDGGGIWNSQKLRLKNVKVAFNNTNFFGWGGGGGIWNEGELTIKKSIISNNISFHNSGGGINNHRAKMRILSNTIIKNNQAGLGGGIFNTSDTNTVIIKDTIISGNRSTIDLGAPAGGGGISHFGGAIKLLYSELRDNYSATEGGGISIIANGHTSFVADHVTIEGNQAEYGGGVYIDDLLGPQAFVKLKYTTVSNNLAISGGGVYQGTFNGFVSPLVIRNSTISNNQAEDTGAGLYTFGDVKLLDSTVVENQTTSPTATSSGMGAHFSTTTSAEVYILRSLIANNKGVLPSLSPDCRIDPTVNFNSLDYNLLGIIGPTCSFTSMPNDQIGSAGSPIDPSIGPLQNNGGFTHTHELLLGSTAIDNAGPAPCGISRDDQRDALRPVDGDSDGLAECDIGAFEL